MGASLTSLLAVFRPEGSLAEPLNQILSRALGWLAAAAPVWLAAGSALLIARRGQPWPWIRIAAAAAWTFAILGLADLEALRRGMVLDDGGGGFVGHAVATALAGWVGISSAAIVLLAVILASISVVTGLRPAQVFRAGQRTVSLALGAFATVGSHIRRPRLQINSVGARVPRPLRASRRASSAEPAEETDVVEPHAAGRAQPSGPWKTPPLSMFQRKPGVEPAVGELKEQARVIEETLASFNIEVRVAEVNQGPAVTQYGLEPAIGVPVSRITARLNDLALRLGASPIRMEAPVPGRRVVGIEVPNQAVSVVHFRDVLDSAGPDRLRARIPLALGKDIGGKVKVGDLARMPHLLIAGATGSGKSVCINSIVACLLTQFTPDDLQLIMIDPKMVELAAFNGVPHLRMPVVVEMDKVVGTLKWTTIEMERRYKLFAAHAARNIDGYNRAVRGRDDGEKPLPNLVLIIDELADLMMTAPEEAERTICRLAQLARATGIHLIVATQRPSVDVLTGLIKANFPTRIAFAVTSQVDSRVILDTVGAERLLGRGDMLYLPPDSSKPIRLQGTYVSDDEIESLVAYWRGLGMPQYDDEDLAEVDNLGRPAEADADDLYDRAVAIAQESRRISVSLLQRRLGIGYPRAARLVDQLEERGIVSAPIDGRSREVMPESRYTDD
jgi:S-DNA-T family DNA segregation ATPase FtsK/SpoIIIE